jgi:N-acylneuraminate cytidylyltransferase
MSGVLGIIPARGGSKGVPGKNIRPLGGKPLLVWTLEAARAATAVDKIVCSTDSPEIAAIAEAHGLQVPFLRPAELAGDRSKVQDAVIDVLDRLDLHPDYLLLLQPTTPFRSSADIDRAVELAREHDATSVVSFSRVETHHPYYMYHYGESPLSVKPLFTYPPGTPRQEFPPIVYRNGAIYLVKTEWFLEHHAFVSPDVLPMLMPPEHSINVDTEEDFSLAEYTLSSNRIL